MARFSANELELIESALNGELPDKLEQNGPEYRVKATSDGLDEMRPIFRIVPSEGAALIESTWYNFMTVSSPTPKDIATELIELSEMTGQISEVVERSPYEFDRGDLRPNENNPTIRGQVSGPDDKFSPSLLFEAEDVHFALGMSHKDMNGLD